jgi:hypothetical protein
VREELFGVERLEQHAKSLAAAQPVTTRPPVVLSLHTRLNDNAGVLLAAYRASAAELESGRGVVPAAEWLLDNYHLVEEQIREIRDDLPPGYYRQLPKLAEGPFAGYPRVFGLAWAFVAHSDSHFDPDMRLRCALFSSRTCVGWRTRSRPEEGRVQMPTRWPTGFSYQETPDPRSKGTSPRAHLGFCPKLSPRSSRSGSGTRIQ